MRQIAKFAFASALSLLPLRLDGQFPPRRIAGDGRADTLMPAPLVVRTGDRLQTVTTVKHPAGGRAIRADLLARALGGSLRPDVGMRYIVEIDASHVGFDVGGSLAMTDDDTVSMTTRAYRDAGQVYVPLAFAMEALPRLASGVLYDSSKLELRKFAAVNAVRPVGLPAPPGPRRPSPPATAGGASHGEPRETNRTHVVIVDAGHGGRDRGMQGPLGSPEKVYEKDITLAVAHELRAALERRGVRVVMTRSTDTLIALDDRGRIANRAKGDLFISVHVNAANPGWASPGGARGYETYFLAEAKTEDERRVEAMENESVRFETSADVSRDDPLGFIMRDMAQNEHLRESSRVAQLMQDRMRAIHPGPSRGVKQAGFRVLVTAFMPAVLVEIGFGTNRAESQWMSDVAKQRELAESLASAAMAYLEEYDRKIGATP